MKAALVKKIEETSDVMSFVFEPEKPIDWKAGQFVFYKIDHPSPDNRGPIRHFTISTSPHEGKIMLTTKFPEDSVSTFKQALRGLPVGSEVVIFSVEGKFTIKDSQEKHVFIAGGIGITPFRSILFDLDYKDSLEDIILIYANRNQEIVFKNQLEELAKKHDSLKIKYVIQPEMIDADLIKKTVPDLADYIFYISGSEGFVMAVKKYLLEIGVSKSSVASDYFPGYKEEY